MLPFLARLLHWREQENTLNKHKHPGIYIANSCCNSIVQNEAMLGWQRKPDIRSAHNQKMHLFLLFTGFSNATMYVPIHLKPKNGNLELKVCQWALTLLCRQCVLLFCCGFFQTILVKGGDFGNVRLVAHGCSRLLGER